MVLQPIVACPCVRMQPVFGSAARWLGAGAIVRSLPVLCLRALPASVPNPHCRLAGLQTQDLGRQLLYLAEEHFKTGSLWPGRASWAGA